MAQLININTFGNQSLRASLNNIPLLLVIEWDGRNNRYMMEITNSNTLITIEAQSVEPFSSMDIQDIGLGDNFLIPVMNNPTYDDSGEIIYQFEDLGENLVIGLFLPEEIISLSVYAPITTL